MLRSLRSCAGIVLSSLACALAVACAEAPTGERPLRASDVDPVEPTQDESLVEADAAAERGPRPPPPPLPAADAGEAPMADAAPPAPDAAPPEVPAFPRAAKSGECRLGNGLYCGGNGVTGATGTLYRCSGGSVDVAKTCASACLFFPDGKNDACAGDVEECPFGNGLYCGGNGLTGDRRTLYRCRNGDVSVAETCASGCSKQPAGTNDHCK